MGLQVLCQQERPVFAKNKKKPCPWAIWPIGLSTNPITKLPLDSFRLPVTRSYLKIRILVQDQGGSEFRPAGILKYVEDLKRDTNAEIEPKNFFEMTSSLISRVLSAKVPYSGFWQSLKAGWPSAYGRDRKKFCS